MNGSRRLAGLAVVAALCLMLGNVTTARAQAATAAGGQAAAGGQDAAKPQYTMAEYNAYTAAQATKDPTAQIKQQHANFRAQPRPDKVPAVTFQQNYRIQGSDRWQGSQYEVFRSYHPERHDRL